MSQGIKKTIGRVLMGIGLVLFIIGVSYQVINFPWRPFLLKMGMSFSEELPDPPSLPQQLQQVSENTETPKTTENQVGIALPDPDPLLIKRGNITLEQIGIVKFPRLGISENIVEGTDEELLYAVGHIRGTAMPGEKGNCVLAGHRNFVQMHPFKHLDMSEIGDKISVEYNGIIYTYEVYKNFSVYPQEVWVTTPQEDQESMLTVITCSPGMHPTSRVIVWAKLVGQEISQRQEVESD